MPFKIIKTFEKGKSKLSIVPSEWEENGILHWPKYNEYKLRRQEFSSPQENWRKFNCKVKRSNLITFLKAEQELDKMCNKSETETDSEQYSNNVRNQKVKTFEEIVQDCIANDNISPEALAEAVGAVENDVLCQPVEARNLGNASMAIQHPAVITDSNTQQNLTQSDEIRNLENALIAIQHPAVNIDSNTQQNVTQPDETRNLDNSLIVIQPPAFNTDCGAQQNETTEVQIDNTALNLMILSKIETLQENYKTLNEKITENIKTQEDDRKFMSESVRSILLGLSNINVQFECVMNQFSRVENIRQTTNIQKIGSENDLNNFENLLENPEAEEEWKKKFSIICGKGKGRGINNAYALVDSMFTRGFLLQCSWAGGSRTSEQKICFKSHTKIINFFFDIIHESDSSFTLLECHKFFKNILKNSRKRCESKQQRTSKTKNRPKIKANRKGNQPPSPIPGTSGVNSAPVVEYSDSENGDDSMS